MALHFCKVANQSQGEEIPLEARLFAIVDVWDAVTSDRPYRKAWSSEQAIEHIKSQTGKHFDPNVVDVFLQVISANGAYHAH